MAQDTSPSTPSRKSTAQLSCVVKVQALREQSNPAEGRYAYAYTITIRNTGSVTAQVVGRRWQITDARGDVQEVRGLAVVGHQPVLKPGEQFEYTSWVQMGTPTGSMRGQYLCVSEDTEVFESEIPEFVLVAPQALH